MKDSLDITDPNMSTAILIEVAKRVLDTAKECGVCKLYENNPQFEASKFGGALIDLRACINKITSQE